ncbi:MAG: tRNA (adenosine(37)-N6)-threonylcarbamoyltransferase complex dimerization subunit type 1 TsaB, partial [Pseudomonadota bacterium]
MNEKTDRNDAGRSGKTPTLLALDTSTLLASVAVTRGDETLSECESRVSTHSERLLPLIDDAIAKAGVSLEQIDALVCGAGPGSFTGLRIGYATAKGLCFALGKPLATVSSLQAVAARACALAGGKTTLVLAILDARKKEVYAGIYRWHERLPELVTPEVVLPPASLPALVARAKSAVASAAAATAAATG